ncbi:MAG: hypothetical protein DIJKHBIC_04226 [Thermoanaerobaculia bacterium]|nr:hypothetical protein [Thermoanaerobaculia bacterium]
MASSSTAREGSGPQYRSLFENAGDGIMIVDSEGRILKANRIIRERLGYEPQELAALRVQDIDSPEAARMFQERIEAVRGNGLSVFESEHVTRQGLRIPVEISCRAIEYRDRPAFLAVVRDITDRKNAEALLCIQRDVALAMASTSDLGEAMSRLLEGACRIPEIDCGGLYVLDETAKTLTLISHRGCSEAFIQRVTQQPADSELMQRARTGETICGLYSDLRPLDTIREREGLLALIVVPILHDGELVATMHLGSHRKGSFSESTKRGAEAIAAMAGGTLARIRAEMALRQYAETQATLLKEVNHRVKNNLVAILAVVHKEEDRAAALGLEPILPILSDLAARLRALSMVHQLLSGSGWRPLPLTVLCEGILRSTFKGAPHPCPAGIHVQSAPGMVSSSEAHHLALVINELAINSLKHGSEPGRPVQIKVRIEAAGRRRTLAFKDDGPGFPKELLANPASQSGTGLDLIRGIVRKSLRGLFSLSNDGGALTTISFESELDAAEPEPA